MIHSAGIDFHLILKSWDERTDGQSVLKIVITTAVTVVGLVDKKKIS